MFYCLTGRILRTKPNAVVLECGDVGFLCNTTAMTIEKLNGQKNNITLYTHLNVKEDALDLFGFYDEFELDCFRLLIGVNGVGPKAALSILSTLNVDRLALCVASGDYKSITKAPGVGPKIAQRIVMELKDKMKKDMPTFAGDSVQAAIAATQSSACQEAVEALVALGYQQSDAAAAVGTLDQSLSCEQMIRLALKMLSRA